MRQPRFTVMVELTEVSREELGGSPAYYPASDPGELEPTIARAREISAASPELHVRVYVEWCAYDVADFGNRPPTYKPSSRFAKVVPGIPPGSRCDP